jgi:hypothetical protein
MVNNFNDLYAHEYQIHKKEKTWKSLINHAFKLSLYILYLDIFARTYILAQFFFFFYIGHSISRFFVKRLCATGVRFFCLHIYNMLKGIK